MSVRTAVVPAAGMGTRMKPMTNAMPKELLPVGKLPMIFYAIAEAEAAGIDKVYVIVNEARKAAIKEFFTRTEWRALIPYRRNHAGEGRADFELRFLNQPELLGVVDAVKQASHFIGQEPFLLLMPDNVYFASQPSTVELLNCFKEYRCSVLGLMEVTAGQGKLFGNSGRVVAQSLTGTTYAVKRLSGKGRGSFETGSGACTLRTCGRAILSSDFFQQAASFDKAFLAKHDEVPILQRIVEEGRMLGVLLRGKIFDCGNWDGYWAANRYWHENKEQWN